MTQMTLNEKQVQEVQAEVAKLRKDASNSTELAQVLAKRVFEGDLDEATDIIAEIKRGRADYRASFKKAEDAGMDAAVKTIIDNRLEGKSLAERVDILTKIAIAVSGFGIRDEKEEQKIIDVVKQTMNLVEGSDVNDTALSAAEEAVDKLEEMVMELADHSAECVLASSNLLDILSTVDGKSAYEISRDAYDAEEAILFTAVAMFIAQNGEEFAEDEMLTSYEIGTVAAMSAEMAGITAKAANGEVEGSIVLEILKWAALIGIVIVATTAITYFASTSAVVIGATEAATEAAMFAGLATEEALLAGGDLAATLAAAAATSAEGAAIGLDGAFVGTLLMKVIASAGVIVAAVAAAIHSDEVVEKGYNAVIDFAQKAKAWFNEKVNAKSVGEIVGKAEAKIGEIKEAVEAKIDDVKEKVGEYVEKVNEARNTTNDEDDDDEDEGGEFVTC